jgi:DNA transformation protein and related proteins
MSPQPEPRPWSTGLGGGMFTSMDTAEIEEMFEGLGPVSIRRMFGGKGVYRQGLIIAVEFEGEMLLKADGESAPVFEAAGARPWTYDGQPGRPVRMPYWSIPDEAYDDPEAMARWVRLAFEASCRVEAAKAEPRASRRWRTPAA